MPSVTTNAGSAGSNNTTVTSTGSTGAPGASETWSSTGNYTGASDSVLTVSSGGGASSVTQSLDAYNFAPGLTGGSSVTGISYSVRADRSNTNRVVLFYGRTLFIGGSPGTPTTTDLVGTALTTSLANYVIGSSTDTWGFSGGTLSVSNMNSATENTGPTMCFWWEHTTGASANTVQADSISQTITYSASSPPGVPTGLTASFASPTSVALSWAQGSGTVTNNTVEFSVDGVNWSLFNPNAAVTSATITGLTNSTLYYFRIDAENGNGSSGYCTPVIWVAGANLTLQIVTGTDDAFQNASAVVTTGDTTDTITGAPQLLGFRFQNITYPKGQVFSQAFLYVNVATAGGGDGVLVDCELATNSSTFSASSNNIGARSLTVLPLQASMSCPGNVGWLQSPNIAAQVQSVLAQTGWSSGNALSVIVHTISQVVTLFYNLPVNMFENGASTAAVLALFTGVPPIYDGTVVGSSVAMGSGMAAPRVVMISTAVARASTF